MRKQNGFTLIELLAVIVILAVIALIATPVIMGVIDEAKMGAFKDSIYGIIKAGELSATKSENGTILFEVKNTEIVDDENQILPYKGHIMKAGMISFSHQGKSSLALWDGTYCGLKSKNNSEITVKKADSLKKCVPDYDIGQQVILSDGSQWRVVAVDDNNPLEVTLFSEKNLTKGADGIYKQDNTDTTINSKNAVSFDPIYKRTASNGNPYCVNSATLGCNVYEKNGTTVTMDSAIKESVEQYQMQLVKSSVISKKTSVSLISKETLEDIGCDSDASGNTGHCINAPNWTYGSSYWTKSKEGKTAVDVWVIYSNGDMSYDCAMRPNTFGIRPTVTLPIVLIGGIDGKDKTKVSRSTNAVWIWANPSDPEASKIIFNEQERTSKLDLLKNNKFNTIYLDMNPDRMMDYKDFVIDAKERGIKVFSLLGDPSFIVPHNYQSVINSNMDKISAFNQYLDGKAKVSGIHYDAEYIGFPDQDFGSGPLIIGQSESAKRQSRRLDFITFVRTAKKYADKKKLLVEHDISSFMNMETFYDTDGVEKNMLDEILKSSDGITLMSYGNGTKNTLYPVLYKGPYHYDVDASNIHIQIDKNYIEKASTYQIPIIIGQDLEIFENTAKELADNPSKGPIYLPEYQNVSGTTDYKFSKGFVNRVMNEITNELKKELTSKNLDNKFGFAFHDYRYLIKLLNQTE